MKCRVLCVCLSVSVPVWEEVTVGYARLRGSMGATFCPLAALPSAIEFLFWDHWETAVLGQILAGRSREVTGGYGRLRREKRRKVQQKGKRKPKKMTEMSSVKCRVWSVEWKV